MSHPSLSPAEAERLEMLIEECAETVIACTKILRHGYESYNPDWEGAGPGQNREDLEEEIMDIHAVISMMKHREDINSPDVSAYLAARIHRKMGYTHHQGVMREQTPPPMKGEKA